MRPWINLPKQRSYILARHPPSSLPDDWTERYNTTPVLNW